MDVALCFIIGILTAAYADCVSKSTAVIVTLIVLAAYFLITNKKEKPLSLERNIKDLESELNWTDTKILALKGMTNRGVGGLFSGWFFFMFARLHPFSHPQQTCR